MEFRILGPVELRANGESLDLGSPKERCVLAMLLWRLGQPVSADTLVDGIWGGNPPARARSSLHSYVSRLRRVIRVSTQSSLRWRSGYYTMDADPGAVDLYRFRSLRQQARSAGNSGDDDQAAALLRVGEELWRAAPLADLSGEWADRTRVKLEAEHFDAILDRIDVELRLGRHASLIGEISDLVAEHPFDETLIRHLMLALHRSGRRADALETYRQASHRLRVEVGSEPGVELRALHERMLHEDPELAIAPAKETVSAGARPNSLPRDNPDFTGRYSEMQRLLGLLDSERARSAVIVTAITGMAGVGKTTFAIRAAHLLHDRYPESFYLSLRTHDHLEQPMDPATGLGMLLRTIGVAAGRIPSDLEERAALWRTTLANRRALLVLDDASEAEQVRPLLPGSAGCLVLITSRHRVIGIPGTSWLPLSPMRSDEAAALFAQVAGDERAEDETAVAEVVSLCGYLPLRIQLEASRFRQHPAWSVGDLAMQLARSHGSGSSTRAEDREVANSLDLSYQYLSSEQQRVFRQLSLHPGASFSVFAAAAAADSHSLTAIEQLLEPLLDNHLLDEPEPGRFTFHDLIRDYAFHRSQLDDQESDRNQAIRRVLDYYLCLADHAAKAVFPFQRRMNTEPCRPVLLPALRTRDEYQLWLEAERDNMLNVVRYAAANRWHRHAGLLPHLLAQFLDAWGFWADSAELHGLAVSNWRAVADSHGEANALSDQCLILGRIGRYDEALKCGNAALAIFRSRSDESGQAESLDRIGLVLWQSSRYREALGYHEMALAIWRSIGDKHGEADALEHKAISLSRTSKYQDAIKCATDALVIYREFGDLRGQGNSLNNIAGVRQRLGAHDEALDLYRTAMQISQDIGDTQGSAIVSNNIGDVLQSTGRYDQSLNYYRQALAIYRTIGDRRCEVDTLNNMGEVFRRLAYYKEASAHHQKALAIAHELADSYQQARAFCNLGRINLHAGKRDTAAEDYRGARELAHRIGDSYLEGVALEGLGDVSWHAERVIAARNYWREAFRLFDSLGVPERDAVSSRLDASNPRLQVA